ncbi:glycosyltransferase family 4 protein [Christiangramia crocea]|uniref:Glycosyltransferase family 4 protein n=1 Tax=Christiangramia crocea TaxID=2904124 RepID=A0A9X1UWN8_9FLAO|nr:glycosyltransferase family 4 protein [Gramella crocea]MCG9971664.1 glycosyltransferase family 4 protein [Gramella crocea]
MRIAQVAPLYESIPPIMYGGTERVVHYITEELVKQGHEVSLFASGDSKTSARLIPVCQKSLRLDPECIDSFVHHTIQLQMVQKRISDFDIIHYHTDYFHFPLSQINNSVHLTTLHGRLDLPDLQGLYKVFSDIPLISISNNQRTPLPWANWIDTIYHGLPIDLLQPTDERDEYLAFLGRISPEKGIERAIDIAKRIGIKLKVAAKVDKADLHYFKTKIASLLDHELIEFIGEIGEHEKSDFLGKATALLFPITWCEPFGLVMIEAMACGTPVIAWNKGSVPEVIDKGQTGFIVNSVKEAIQAIKDIDKIDRKGCRRIFEEKFTAERMTRDYLRIYDYLIKKVKPVNLKLEL